MHLLYQAMESFLLLEQAAAVAVAGAVAAELVSLMCGVGGWWGVLRGVGWG